MIIEFAGLPASGKSVASAHLTDWIRAARPDLQLGPGVGSGSAAPAHWHSLRHPRLVAAILVAIVRSRRSWSERSFALRRTLVTAGVVARARADRSPTSLVVLSEGICQRTFLAFVDADGVAARRIVRRYLAAGPEPDVVIALRVSPAIALERLRQRGYGALSHRFASLNEHQLEQRFEAGQQLLLDAVEDLASLRTDVRTLVLDADRVDAALAALDRAVPTLLLPEVTP